MSPSGHREYYLNSYAALRELAEVSNSADENRLQGSIEVPPDAEHLPATIDIAESPFDVYGRLGVQQERVSSKPYLSTMNQVVANAVLTFCDQMIEPERSGLAKFAQLWDGPGGEACQLFSVDGATVRYPIEEIRRVSELNEDIRSTEREIKDLKKSRASNEDALWYLQNLLSWSPDAEVDGEFSDLVERCRERVDNVHMAPAEEKFESHVNGVEIEITPPRQLDNEDVARSIFGRLVEQRAGHELEKHPFPDRLLHLYEKRYMQINGSGSPTLTPVQFWDDTLEPHLKTVERSLESDMQDVLAVKILRQRRLQQKLDQVREDRSELRRLANQYRQLQTIRDLGARWQDAQIALCERRNILEDRVGEKARSISELKREIEKLRSERDRLQDQLSEGKGYLVLPVSQIETMDPQEINLEAGLRGLIESGYLESEALSRALERAIGSLDEPTEDRRSPGTQRSTASALSILASDENLEYVQALRSRSDGNLSLSSVFSRFRYHAQVETDSPLSISAVGIFSPVLLEKTSEFGTLHEYYTDNERDLSEQFSGEITDSEMTQHFAYPELFDEGTQIGTYHTE